MTMQKKKNDTNKELLIAITTFILLTFILFVRFFDGKVSWINATMLAFSYKYGFISRGLVGTVYAVLNRILPFDMMNYAWTYRFTFAVQIPCCATSQSSPDAASASAEQGASATFTPSPCHGFSLV